MQIDMDSLTKETEQHVSVNGGFLYNSGILAF